jgi:adenine/guanine phosphoribosyltransferase-like PRPP-binding protein
MLGVAFVARMLGKRFAIIRKTRMLFAAQTARKRRFLFVAKLKENHLNKGQKIIKLTS